VESISTFAHEVYFTIYKQFLAAVIVSIVFIVAVVLLAFLQKNHDAPYVCYDPWKI
jgi:hypothetical protein